MDTKESALAHLELGSEVRFWRARQRKAIKGGDIDLACELLLGGDHRLKTLRIGDFLDWLPNVGPRRAALIMRPAFQWYHDGTPHRQIGSLDLETCLRLVAEIRKRLIDAEGEAA